MVNTMKLKQILDMSVTQYTVPYIILLLQSMNGSLPPMYPPYPMAYPGYPHPIPPYPHSYGGMTPGTSMSEVKHFSDEDLESGEEASLTEDRVRYRMGALLGTVVEDFHRGDEILQKEDTRKSKSSLLNLTSKSRSKK